MHKQNNHRSKNTRDFLLSFFQSDEKYEEKEVNGFILIKQFTNYVWNVAIYTKQAYFKKTEHKRMFASTYKNKPRGNSVSEQK